MLSKEIRSYAQFKTELLVKSIQEIGLTNLFKILEDLRKDGKLTSNQKFYAKQDLEKLLLESCSLIELDHTVELMTQMHFLYEDLNNDEFTQLKKNIIKKDIKDTEKRRPYRDLSEELKKISSNGSSN